MVGEIVKSVVDRVLGTVSMVQRNIQSTARTVMASRSNQNVIENIRRKIREGISMLEGEKKGLIGLGILPVQQIKRPEILKPVATQSTQVVTEKKEKKFELIS